MDSADKDFGLTYRIPAIFPLRLSKLSIQAGIRACEAKLSFLRVIVFPGKTPSDGLMTRPLTHRCGGSTGIGTIPHLFPV